MSVRTRFAPSPTGYVHIGGLRTILYSYLWAQKNMGQYILRIEDTDRTRLVEGAVDEILAVHDILGIHIDESLREGGAYGPYVQSERLPLYQERLHKLCKEGSAYYCFCSSERLAALKKEQEALGLPPRYDGYCRNIPYEEALARVEADESYTIRLKVPKGEVIVFQDLIRGRIEFRSGEVDDQVLLKSDGFPTYHGAIVIDDFLMKITHVMRGEEWISSIPKQVLTARALGITLPAYAHLPNVLGQDGKKLSKRTGDVSVREYLKKGYIPQALLNFLALLGWHPKQQEEIMSFEDMVEKFEITDIHKSGAILNTEKLDWMNGEYIKAMESEQLHKEIIHFLQTYQTDFYTKIFSQKSYDYNHKIICELQTRLRRLDEYIPLTSFFYQQPKRVPALLVHEKMKITTEQQGREALQFLFPLLEATPFESLEHIQTSLLTAIAEAGKKNGQILWPLRVALSGEPYSPGAFEMAFILGKTETLARIQWYLL